jgi:hypothetical protein
MSHLTNGAPTSHRLIQYYHVTTHHSLFISPFSTLLLTIFINVFAVSIIPRHLRAHALAFNDWKESPFSRTPAAFAIRKESQLLDVRHTSAKSGIIGCYKQHSVSYTLNYNPYRPTPLGEHEAAALFMSEQKKYVHNFRRLKQSQSIRCSTSLCRPSMIVLHSLQCNWSAQAKVTAAAASARRY